MCNTYSESGKPCGVQRCEEYILLQSDRDRLAGVVQGVEEQSKRNMEALNKENIVMRRQMERLIDERDALLKVREAADALVEVADVIRRIHVGDHRSGLKVAIDAYKEARDGIA